MTRALGDHAQTTAQDAELGEWVGNPWRASILAWILPGAGHFYLRKWERSVAFFLLALASLAVGLHLGGELPWSFSQSFLDTMATLGGLGSGAPVLILRFVFGYSGDLSTADFFYGRGFILTAGVMNWLLVIDAWQIACGDKD